jgi:hypothetical protein
MSDIREITKKTGTFAVFKKSAAAKISLIPPTYNERGWIDREGSVMIEAAASTGKEDPNGNVIYNWGEKHSVSLGMNDLCLLFDNFSKSLVHDYKGKLKTITFVPGSEKYPGTYMLNLTEKSQESGDRKVTIPISAGETQALTMLLRHALPRMIGW